MVAHGLARAPARTAARLFVAARNMLLPPAMRSASPAATLDGATYAALSEAGRDRVIELLRRRPLPADLGDEEEE